LVVPKSAAPGTLVRSWVAHTNSINSVAISPDGREIISASNDGTAKRWDAATGRLLGTFGPIVGASEVVSFHPVSIARSGYTIATGHGDGVVRLWGLEKKNQLLNTLEKHKGPVWDVALSPDGRKVVSVDHEGEVKIWDAVTGGLIRTLSPKVGWLETVDFSPDGALIVVAGVGGRLLVYNVASGQQISSHKAHAETVSSAVFVRTGQFIVSGAYDKYVVITDVLSGQVLKRLSGHTGYVRSVAVTSDARFIVSGSYDKTVKIWEYGSGQLIKSIPAHDEIIESVALAPDGRWFVSAGCDGRAANKSCTRSDLRIWSMP
ncbi:MAG TPA: WD40 repeat domain-containing protein, partial [Hyphomicrobiaceae bacterium]|nr:WD40 repeat domain-containing protein [Hyphomicrobiaceae bacterium]